ncbi:MAG: hypothetical protein AB1797_05475 [bacterium]
MAKQKGWIKTKEWSRFDFGGESIVDMPGISAKEVTHYRQKAFKVFYFRPRKILIELKKMRNIRNLFQALSFVRWIR